MEYQEVWSVSCERIQAFFRSQPDVRESDGGFRYGDCAVTLEEMPDRSLGNVAIPRTLVTMRGPDPDTEAIHSRFFFRFLSAGG